MDNVNNNKTIWVGPIQGGEHLDLVAFSAKSLHELGFSMFALGSPTEVMESYEFKMLAKMIIAAKRAIPSSKPFHLFGAGHPLTIPLAVALGCDTFDSASYMLYARDGRYILPNATVRMEQLRYLPCTCKVCTSYTSQELRELGEEKRFVELATHNLHTIKLEVEAVKQAITEGRLWEYCTQKALSHPRLAETLDLLREEETMDYLGDGTPVSKQKAVFLFSELDQYRPEVRRFRRFVENTRSNKSKLLLLPEPDQHPFTTQYRELRKLIDESIQLAYYSPFLGIVPEEISDIYPASHHVYVRKNYDPKDFGKFEVAFRTYIETNRFKTVVAVSDSFIEYFIRKWDNKEINVLPFTSKMKDIADAINAVKIEKK